MAEQLLRELEEAAQIILAPPNLVTQQQRQTAEAVFLNFQKTKSPYQLCRQILETSTTDYVLFEAAGLLKTAIVQEWSTLPEEDIASLRQYLLHYVTSKPSMAPYVKGRMLQVIAIIIKRGSISDMGDERRRILGEIENLIISGDFQRQILGCSMISAIMQEYATNAKSSDIGLKLEVHFKEKKLFEASELKRIFKFCIGILSEVVKKDIQEENTLTLMKHLLTILEDVLVWRFRYFNYYIMPRALIGAVEAICDFGRTPALRLTSTWQDVMLDPAVLDMFFTTYWKVRSNPQLAHHARVCLVQLSSLSGTVVADSSKLQYLSDYMQRFLNLVSSIEIIDQEAAGIASIIQKLITFFHSALTYLPEQLLKSFMEQIVRLTCLFIENAAQEESLCADDCFYMEALSCMFETWISILAEKNVFSIEFCKQSSAQIFNIYLRCHLSPPEGVRGTGKDLREEEIDVEEDDKVRFKEHLQTIGNFGRQIPSHSLPLLAQLIEDRTSKLRDHLNTLVGQVETMNRSQNDSMVRLYEDIHWLLLVAGHVLCMESEGETALIPSEIMRYSMDQVSRRQTDINLTLQLLASSQNVQSELNPPTESIDHVIRLVADIFRLCAIEKTAISIHLESILSPELSCTIMWFLHRWSLSYLLPVENYYREISTTFAQAFGEDSQGALWAMNFLLEKIECNINAFKGEPALIKETIKLLTALVESQKADYVLKSEKFGAIMELATKGQRDFSQTIKRGLMRALVQVGASVRNSSTEQNYWVQAFQCLQDRCKQVTSNENFLSSYHQEEFKVQIIDILELFIGVAQGAHGPIVGPVFRYSYPVLQELPNLLSLYRNYQQIIQLILELLCECTKGILCYLPESNSVRLYEVCLHTIQTYARCNTNRVTVDSTAEEDSYQDILLLMQLLTNVLPKDIFNLSFVEGQPVQEQQSPPPSSITPADVFLCGLNIIMPMMTMDLLKFPSLCLQYFKMITFVCEIYPEKVCSLSPDLLQQLLASVELGLYSFGFDVAVLCCGIIQVLANHIYSEAANGHPRNQLMSPFLNLLMSLILSHQMDSDIVPSTPLYYLICCYQEQYQQLVQNILSSQTDQQVAQRLANAFTSLTANVELSTSRIDKQRFKENFDKFIIDVQGFLMVK